MGQDCIATSDTRTERLEINAQEARETEMDWWSSRGGRSLAWESQTLAFTGPARTAAVAWPSAMGFSGLSRYTRSSSFTSLPLRNKTLLPTDLANGYFICLHLHRID